MGKLNVRIMTPQAEFFSGEADSVVFTLSDGTCEVLYNRAPAALALSNGFIRIKNGDTEFDIMTSEGFCEISHNKVEVFVDRCALSEKELSFDEMRHMSKMENERRSVLEHHHTKIVIARALAQAKKNGR